MKLAELQQLCEAKQVGILYHRTTPMLLLDIIESGYKLKPAIETGSNVLGQGKSECVSFTRKNEFLHRYESFLLAQLVIDGNKLSSRYKIVPHADKNYGRMEAEERICGQTIDVAPSLIRVEIDADWLDKHDYGLPEKHLEAIDKKLRSHREIHFVSGESRDEAFQRIEGMSPEEFRTQ